MITALAPPTIRIVLADDHDFVRMGIKALLSRIDGAQVIGEARDGAELIALVAGLAPDLVLTDISMPGIDGIAAITEIHGRYPQVKVLVLSMHDSVELIKQAIGKGACGYLMKDAPSFEVEQALRSVMTTGSYFSASISQRLLQPSAPTAAQELTPRQLEILTLIAKGHAAKQIGHQLGLSSKTVDVHRAHIMERLQLHDIASLTKYAVRKGLITL
jgi:two-component system, NarL family, nitrate/nitrite response regulator NarL